MKVGKLWWLVIPLAIGCAGSQRETVHAGGKSTLSDEGPANGSTAQAQAGTAQPGAAGAGAAATGAAATGAAMAQPGSQLVPFQSQGGYTILMPPNPQQSERTQESPGGPVQVHIAQAQDSSGKYLASDSVFPQGSLKKIQPKDLLDSLQQATVQSMGGTLVGSRDVQAGGLPGREFTATDPQGSQVTARLFVADSRVYTLAGTYAQGQMPGSIQQFLGSFAPPPRATGGSGAASDGSSDGATQAAPGGDVSSGDGSGSTSVTPAEPARKSRRSATSTQTTDSTTETSRSGQ